MQKIEARQIVRSIFINQNTIKFCDEELIQRFRKIHLLEGYIEQEIKQYNTENNIDTAQESNRRRITNLGTFRAYLVNYLRKNPKINQDLTVLFRQHAPTTENSYTDLCF